MIIGLTGYARSGKDTVAEMMMDILANDTHRTYALAKPLKEAAAAMFGIDLEYFYEDDLKEVVINEWGMSPRQMLQRLGTEGVRNTFGPDFWIKRAEFEYTLAQSESFNLIVTDVRFENEADWVRSRGTLVHVSRPSATGNVGESNHASEAGIVFKTGDITIINDGSKEDLLLKTDCVLGRIYPTY